MTKSKECHVYEDQDLIDRGGAGGSRSEPGGRAQRPAGGAPLELPDAVRDRLADEVIDELLAGARTEEEIVGPGGVLAQLTKRLVERAMSAELTEHLGYEPHQEPPGGAGNTRNGSTAKTLATEHGPVRIETPRDRKGSFEPQIVRKGQRRFEGFDDKILALYSRGLSTRDIEAHLAEIYGVKVGRDLISRVTDAVMDDVRAWQQRPLDDVYPVIFLDALVLKIREGGTVQRRACYLALGGHGRRRAGRARDVVPGDRGREVLDAGPGRAAQSDQDERTLPQRGGRPQAYLPRHRQRRAGGVDKDAQLDDSLLALRSTSATDYPSGPPTQKIGRPQFISSPAAAAAAVATRSASSSDRSGCSGAG